MIIEIFSFNGRITKIQMQIQKGWPMQDCNLKWVI